MVPGEGVEPSIPYGRGILSPQRIPVPPPRHVLFCDRIYFLEAGTGIEPVNIGFADPCLTTWLPGHAIIYLAGHAPVNTISFYLNRAVCSIPLNKNPNPFGSGF